MSVGIIRNPIFQEHQTGSHPECPQRLAAIDQKLESNGLLHELTPIDFEPALKEDILRVHSNEVFETVMKKAEEGGGWIDSDTIVSPHSGRVALHSAGAGLAAVKAVLNGEVDRAMCLVRPPGHHATPTRSMGFCLFGNVAIAAEYLLTQEDVSRVAIIDFDVHHGNGTQDCFYERGDVFFLSLHQWPHYPGTGAAGDLGRGKGEGTTLNFPLPGEIDESMWFACFEKGLEAVEEFNPDFVLVSSGFDSHREDPLGDFPLTEKSFERIAQQLVTLSGGRRGMVSFLEGGYNLNALASSVSSYLQGQL
ncbi:MAG: histone deacetylase [Candidatus Omnitrophica bacterium]|nr:histone deacetylase [Candidatus Omnitrophota bacterium]